MAIDYGLKRTGLAVSDPQQIIATALDVVDTSTVLEYLSGYTSREPVSMFVVGVPRRLNNTPSETAAAVQKFILLLRNRFPEIPVVEFDEQFSTIRAQEAMIRGGMKKKDRQVKGNTDKVSATLILQEYMTLRSIKG